MTPLENSYIVDNRNEKLIKGLESRLNIFTKDKLELILKNIGQQLEPVFEFKEDTLLYLIECITTKDECGLEVTSTANIFDGLKIIFAIEGNFSTIVKLKKVDFDKIEVINPEVVINKLNLLFDSIDFILE